GDFDDQVLCARTGAVLPHAMAPALGPEMLSVPEVYQRIETRHGDHHHVAALASVAAVGATVLDELLAPEAHRPRAARTRAEVDLGLVEKMHCLFSLKRRRDHPPLGYPRPSGGCWREDIACADARAQTGRTLVEP